MILVPFQVDGDNSLCSGEYDPRTADGLPQMPIGAYLNLERPRGDFGPDNSEVVRLLDKLGGPVGN